MVDPEQQKTFVVAVRDCEDGDEAELEKRVGERLQAIWAAAVKPEVLNAPRSCVCAWRLSWHQRLSSRNSRGFCAEGAAFFCAIEAWVSVLGARRPFVPVFFFLL